MKALVLAGGFPQVALIKELKSRNITVLLADYNSEPVAKKYADFFYQVSTLDIEAIKKLAIKENVDFLITACTDQALLTVANVSEALGLPCYIDYKTALNVTNKAYMKKVFNEFGISTAKHIIMEEFDENEIADMSYPLIVKPVDCNSSKGVRKVFTTDEARTAFEEAVRLSRTNTAIVEEFKSGVELSADVYVENGKAHVLSVSRLDKIADEDKFIIFRGVAPSKEANAVMPKIETTAQKIADAFGLKNSPMLIQMIADEKDVYVLEFSARTGGGIKYILIKDSSGFDVISAVVDLTLGKKPHVEKVNTNKYIANSFIYCYPGVYDHLEGFEEMKKQGIIDDYYIFKWKGAEFNSVQSSGDRIAGFKVCADTPEELSEKHKIVSENIKVIGSNGEDIMRHDLLTDLD